MRIKVTILLLLLAASAQAQFGFNKVERFSGSLYWDPGASFKEGGIDIGADIQYHGPVFVKAGFESFTVLEGGYFDFHTAVGPNFSIGERSQWNLYAGIRSGLVWRNGSQNPILGFEGGINYYFPSGWFSGINVSRIWREDMELNDKNSAIWVNNFYVTAGYSWEW